MDLIIIQAQLLQVAENRFTPTRIYKRTIISEKSNNTMIKAKIQTQLVQAFTNTN